MVEGLVIVGALLLFEAAAVRFGVSTSDAEDWSNHS